MTWHFNDQPPAEAARPLCRARPKNTGWQKSGYARDPAAVTCKKCRALLDAKPPPERSRRGSSASHGGMVGHHFAGSE
jgi:hypothetical protein